MEYRILGKTGLKVSRVGLGGIPIQRIDAAGTKVLMHHLMEQGVNFVDSARGYSVSEAYLGEALEGIRDKFILATKTMARTKEGMAQDIETSLKNFRTDYIDLYQCHNPSLQDLDTIIGEGGALEALMEAKAAEKNVGFLSMKPLAGGAIEDATLAMRYQVSNPNVTLVIPGMAELAEADCNIAAAADTSPLTAEEQEKCQAIRQQLGSQFCRRCNYCAPCTVGIVIPNVFVFQGYVNRYGLGEWATARYNAMAVKPSACIDCGVCETRCPYQLPIRDMLKKAVSEFGQ